jgi:kynurenine 3-monooxygenase
MTTAGEGRTATIIGAGPAGAAMAIYLGRRGFRVQVLERRSDPRRADDPDAGRSINLGLSLRGIRTLEDVGVLDRVMAGAVPARGRVIHPLKGEPRFQPYGEKEDEILWSISRRELNAALIDRAAAMPNVTFRFRCQCVGVEKETGRATFLDAESNQPFQIEADLVVGADGAFSVARQHMQRGERADFVQEWLPWGYKELRLPPDVHGRSQVFLEALHVWPRGDCVIVTHPNADGSHTVTLFLPHEGEARSFAALKSDEDVLAFFRETFPDLAEMLPDLAGEWRSHPEASLVATRTSMWHWEDRMVLVGDACHAVYPFYGQGMNAAMEDCLTLDRCIGEHGATAAAFARYQRVRKENTDALHELIRRNFVELRETSASPVFVWQKKVDFVLHRILGERWLPPYTMVVHTTMPYADALRRADRQAALRRRAGVDLGIWALLPLDALRRRLAVTGAQAVRGAPETPAPAVARTASGPAVAEAVAAGAALVAVPVPRTSAALAVDGEGTGPAAMDRLTPAHADEA